MPQLFRHFNFVENMIELKSHFPILLQIYSMVHWYQGFYQKNNLLNSQWSKLEQYG